MAKVIPLYPLGAKGTTQVPPPPSPRPDTPDDLVAILSSAIYGLLEPDSEPDVTTDGGGAQIKSIQAENSGTFCRFQIELFWPPRTPGRILPLFPAERLSDRVS